MALFFSCSCGQPLREDEDRAGGQVKCPACSRFVGIPSLYSANRDVGIDAVPAPDPFVPLQFVPPLATLDLKVVEFPVETFPPQRRQLSPADDDVFRTVDEPDDGGIEAVRKRIDRERVMRVLADARAEMAKGKRRRATWPLEQHWFDFLFYPLRAAHIVAGLAVAWATLPVFLLVILPDSWELADIAPRFPFLLFLLTLLGYTLACLQVTYAAGQAGDGDVLVPDRALLASVCSLAQAGLCWLAGPVVPAAVAFFFWLDSGDLTWVDWLILWELSLVAFAYFTLTMLAVTDSERIGDANPAAVLRLVWRRGWRLPVGVAVIAAVVVGHGTLILHALEELHRGPGGWLQLIAYFGGLFFWLLVVARWLGVSSCRRRQRKMA